MPRICYEPKRFNKERTNLIAAANEIIKGFQAQGYDLTLRQLYYQFVTRNLIENKQTEYKRLGEIISQARRAGLIDWNAIVDRTRGLRGPQTWGSPQEIVQACAASFRLDPWATQATYAEVWFEKDALAGVFQRATLDYRLPYFSCRGYASDSEVWSAAQRLAREAATRRQSGRRPRLVVLHFGDHDPSGLDMTRDVGDRLALFGAPGVQVRRMALTMDQVEEYHPPPNPAKEADSRFEDYQTKYGNASWELDALPPTVLTSLVNDTVIGLIDHQAWKSTLAAEAKDREALAAVSNHWPAVTQHAVTLEKGQ